MTSGAAILAIGSELLSGQVTNRNAAWLSSRLEDLGFAVTRHLVVDDREADILDGLDAVAAHADVLFVTGGLGPTSDDLTRQVVAKWVGQPLVYDAASWDHITQLFSRHSRTVPETNRQQCYFPETAKVLTNQAGTANGFVVTASAGSKGRATKEIWVLPGPPPEIEALWRDHIEVALKERIPLANRKRLRMWRTIGRGESHLAETIEPLLQGQDVEVAYRAHAPYVELKIRYPELQAERFAGLCERIGTTLAPWLFEVDDQNVPRELATRLASFRSVEIYDGVTCGNLGELLAEPLRGVLSPSSNLQLITSWEPHASPRETLERWLASDGDADLALGLAGFDTDGRWAIGMRIGDERSIVERQAPYKMTHEAMQARTLKAIASLAAKVWLTLLAGSLH